MGDLKDSGLDASLREAVPMRENAAGLEPEDLSAGEVAHLSAWLVDNPELEEEVIRERLSYVKGRCREVGQFRREIHKCTRGLNLDAMLTLRSFQRLVGVISVLLSIDAEYVVVHAAWLKSRHFELTD